MNEAGKKSADYRYISIAYCMARYHNIRFQNSGEGH